MRQVGLVVTFANMLRFVKVPGMLGKVIADGNAFASAHVGMYSAIERLYWRIRSSFKGWLPMDCPFGKEYVHGD